MAVYFETTVDGVKVSPPNLTLYSGDGSSEVEQTFLVPVRLTWGINGRQTVLEMRLNLGQGPGVASRSWPDDRTGISDIIPSDRIRLTATVGSVETDLFIGYLAQEGELYQASNEQTTFVAYGPEILLSNTAVHGQWHAKPDTDADIITGDAISEDLERDNAFGSDLPVIFNPKGKPNASASGVPWKLGVGTGASSIQDERVFEDPERRVVQPDSSGAVYEAEPWTAYTALKSLLSWFGANDVISMTTFDSHSSDLDLPISDVSVEGLDLVEAISRILIPVGFGFTIRPWQVANKHEIIIFPLHSDDIITGPAMSGGSGGNVTMSSVDGQATIVQRLEFIRDSRNIRNDVEIIGDQIRTQQAFIFDNDAGILEAGWDTAADDLEEWELDGKIPDMDEVTATVYDDSGATDPEDFIDQYSIGGKSYAGPNTNAFRLFAANDDGWLSQFGYEFADLSTYGVTVGSESFGIHRRRPLGRTLIQDLTGTRWRGAYVEIGIIGDNDSWIRFKGAKILQDHLGFRIDVDRVDQRKPYKQYAAKDSSGLQQYAEDTFATLLLHTLQGGSAALGNACRFRLVGTIENDTALVGVSARQSQSLWTFSSERRVSARARYKQFDADFSPAGTVTRDDTSDIDSAADRFRDLSEDAVGHGSIILRIITTEWEPGTPIAATAGTRSVGLVVDNGDVGYFPLVTQLVWNLDDKLNTTELVLDTPLLKVST